MVSKCWFAALLLILAVRPPCASASGQGQTAVWVSADTPDSVGSRLIYALRENLQASSDLRLVDLQKDSFIQIQIVTLNPGNNSYQAETVYSAVITVTQLSNPSVHIYWDNLVGVCGAQRTHGCADSLAATVDKDATTIRTIILSGLSKNR